MKNERIIAAYDSIPMDPELSQRLWNELEKETETQARRVRPRRRLRALLLTAAVLALMSATAYAVSSIHQQRQSELREELKIEENQVSGYVEAELPAEATEAVSREPRAVLLSVLPDFDDFLRVYVDVSPVEPEEVTDGYLMDQDEGSDWDLYGISYLSSVDEEGWQEAFIHTRDNSYTEDELVSVNDPETGVSYRYPHSEARKDKYREQGYDPETKTLTLECSLNRDDVPAGETARLHIISVEYRAKIDAEGIEINNDAQPLRDFGYVEVPLPQKRLRTVRFTEPRSFTVDGEFGPVEGKLVGAELSATGLTWLYEIEGVYGSEDLLAVTDEMERDAVLELRDGSRKPVSLSVRSELGPIFRNICGFAGTLDIDAVIGITAGGVHYDFE